MLKLRLERRDAYERKHRKADVQFSACDDTFKSIRRNTGCLLLFFAGACLRKCTDRKYCFNGVLSHIRRFKGLHPLFSPSCLFCTWSTYGLSDPLPVPPHRTASLAPSGTDHVDHPAVYRRFYPGTVKLACKWAYFLCLCHAGTVFPYCTRQCLCQHHVYRKSAKRHGPFL